MALRQQDITDIQQVQALYGHAVDWPDQSLLPKVFTHDAVFDGRPCGGDGISISATMTKSCSARRTAGASGIES